MKLAYLTLPALCVLASVQAVEEQAPQPVTTQVELHQGPKPINLQPPGYPGTKFRLVQS